MQLFSINDRDCGDPRILEGLEFFSFLLTKPNLEKGLHYKDNSNIFANVIDYTTPVAGEVFEAHRKFIDLQIMVKGHEIVEYVPIHGLEIDTDYNEEDDYLLYHGPKDGTGLQSIILSENNAAVFYPDDAHRPGVLFGEPQDIRKIVVKIPV